MIKLGIDHNPVGNPTMRKDFLPFARPDIDGTELAEIQSALESGWVTTGPKTEQFERDFANYVGARHAIAVNSCTAAMHLALEAIGLGAGDVVLTSPFTFASTAEVVRYFNAVPLFVDIKADTLNMAPTALEVAVEELKAEYGDRLKAVIPVHIAGHPCEMDSLASIAKANEMVVIEDAAHTLPTRYKGKMVGSISDFTCFSFYATKSLTTGEGGMITTADDRWAERCRVMSLHGISKDAWNRYTEEGSWYYEILAPGFKYNMTDVAAAMGIAQLEKVERMWKRRVQIAERYTAAFSDLNEVEPPTVLPDVDHAWHLYILRLHLDRLKIDRGRFIWELKDKKIGVSVHFIPLHLHPYYSSNYGYQDLDFPVAYREYQRVISLPIYSLMTDQDVDDVIEAVIEISAKYCR
jgi:perosamine synthetase